MTIIKARFAPLCAVSSSEDLQSTLKQLLETEFLLKESYQKRRSRLSAKIVKARNRLRNKIKQQATKRIEQAVDLKLKELSELNNSITKNCYENSLQTIKAVCLAVFNEYPEAYSLILQKSLDKAFSQVNSAKILLLKVPEFMADKYRNHPLEISDHCCIEFSSGTLNIDPISELKSGFDNLQAKLENSLVRP